MKLLTAVSAIAEGRVLSREQVEQAEARIREIDTEIQRLTDENRAIAEARDRRIREIETERDQHIAAIKEAARQATDQITTFRDAVLGAIAAERERIQRLAAATAKSDLSVEQVLREMEEGWRRVERGVRERVSA